MFKDKAGTVLKAAALQAMGVFLLYSIYVFVKSTAPLVDDAVKTGSIHYTLPVTVSVFAVLILGIMLVARALESLGILLFGNPGMGRFEKFAYGALITAVSMVYFHINSRIIIVKLYEALVSGAAGFFGAWGAEFSMMFILFNTAVAAAVFMATNTIYELTPGWEPIAKPKDRLDKAAETLAEIMTFGALITLPGVLLSYLAYCHTSKNDKSCR